MKNILSLLTFLFLCTELQAQEKTWLERPVDFSQIREVVNTYHMFDGTGNKVGSMIYGTSFEDGHLVVRDTSQFDDGSVYETIEYQFDTSEFVMKKAAIDMKTTQATLDIDLVQEDGRTRGNYGLTRDTTIRNFPIDSAYEYDVFRGEIYLLLNSLRLQKDDTLYPNALVPTSMNISKGQISLVGEESISTALGTFDCDVVWLKADGVMPDNKIWIRKETPRTMVKFYIPGMELHIELVDQH